MQNARRGFTFVEVLAGLLFMAIVIPVAVEGITLAHRVGIVADRKREAARLCQKVLDEAVATESWRDGEQNAEFGDDWPGYKWRLYSADWTEDGMTEVTAEVTFSALGREYSVAITTITPTESATGSTSSSTGTGSSSSSSSGSSRTSASRSTGS